MKKLSRGTVLALAAAVVAVPATVALAKHYERGDWHRMSPETQSRLDEGRFAMAKTALKLTAEQEPLWAAVEKELKTASEQRAKKHEEWRAMRDERRAERRKGREDGDRAEAPADRKRPDMAERFEKMSTHLSERAEQAKAFSAAFKPFYASLSDEQKDVLRPLMRDLMPGAHGGRGHHHKGGRWADGGWGHGGKHGGHHGWGGRHDSGGPERSGRRMERDDADIVDDVPGDADIAD